MSNNYRQNNRGSGYGGIPENNQGDHSFNSFGNAGFQIDARNPDVSGGQEEGGFNSFGNSGFQNTAFGGQSSRGANRSGFGNGPPQVNSFGNTGFQMDARNGVVSGGQRERGFNSFGNSGFQVGARNSSAGGQNSSEAVRGSGYCNGPSQVKPAVESNLEKVDRMFKAGVFSTKKLGQNRHGGYSAQQSIPDVPGFGSLPSSATNDNSNWHDIAREYRTSLATSVKTVEHVVKDNTQSQENGLPWHQPVKDDSSGSIHQIISPEDSASCKFVDAAKRQLEKASLDEKANSYGSTKGNASTWFSIACKDVGLSEAEECEELTKKLHKVLNLGTPSSQLVEEPASSMNLSERSQESYSTAVEETTSSSAVSTSKKIGDEEAGTSLQYPLAEDVDRHAITGTEEHDKKSGGTSDVSLTEKISLVGSAIKALSDRAAKIEEMARENLTTRSDEKKAQRRPLNFIQISSAESVLSGCGVELKQVEQHDNDSGVAKPKSGSLDQGTTNIATAQTPILAKLFSEECISKWQAFSSTLCVAFGELEEFLKKKAAD